MRNPGSWFALTLVVILVAVSLGFPNMVYGDTTGTTGSGAAATTLQPALAMQYIIATEGIFPRPDTFPDAGSEQALGEIRLFAGTFVPDGWAACDGQLLSIASNPALFALLGTTYGGDGVANFGLPDLRGRAAVLAGQGPGLTNRALGVPFGSNTVSLTVENLASHTHTAPGGATSATGGSQSFENCQPSYPLYYGISPVGLWEYLSEIRLFAIANALFLGKFQVAQGQVLPISGNEPLYSQLGTIYGGDGVTTFGIPDLRGRVALESGQGPSINWVTGEMRGTEAVAPVIGQTPSHTHTILTGNTGATGGGLPFDNVQPTLAVHYAIATRGYYPGRGGGPGNVTTDPMLAEVRPFASNTILPAGWVYCDGQLLSIATNAALFSLMGTTYGGDGRTTFALPDLRGRTPVGVGAGVEGITWNYGEQGGSENVTLAVSNMPGHTHTYTGCPAITLTPASLADATLQVPYSQTVAGSGGTAPYTFLVTAGSLPNGLTLDTTSGVISGTPTQAGSFSFTITATDHFGCTGSQGYTLTVVAMGLVPASLPDGTVGSPYSQTMTAVGGITPPVTISLSAGAPPTGTTLTDHGDGTATLSGTPTQSGAFTFTVLAADSGGRSASQIYTVGIACPTITLTGSLPGGTAGSAYNQTVTASPGGTVYSYALTSGSLPPGLSLDSSSGAVTGTPTTGGSYPFTITATGWGTCTGSQAYTVDIVCPSVVTNLDDAGEGSLRWVVQWACTGATVTFTPGLTGTITLATGAIPIGRALTIVGPGARVLAVDGASLDRVFNHTAGAFTLSGLALQNGLASLHGGGIYSTAPLSLTDCVVSGCTATTGTNAGGGGIYAAGGLTMDRCTLSGNQMTGGGNGGGLEVYSQPCTITNSTFSGNHVPGAGAGLQIWFADGTLLNCTITQNTTGSDYNPGGISIGYGTLHLKNAIVAGNAPAASQIAYFAASLDDQGGNLLSGDPVLGPLEFYGGATPTHALICGSPALDFAVPGYPAADQRSVTRPQGAAADSGAFEANIFLSPALLPSGSVTLPYSQTLTATGGTGPYTFTTANTLPTGLSLAADGQLAGTPTATGSWTFDVVAWDSLGFGGACRYTIGVTCPTLTLAPATLPGGTAGTAYSQTITASGGEGTYTYAVTSGSLPAGLSLSSAGVLSGTPTTSGTSDFTVTATLVGTNCTGSQAYSVTMTCPTLTLAPATLPGGTVGTAYSQTITTSGATGTYTYAVTSGSLPAGLTLSSAGVLSGTPTTSGTSDFTVTATLVGTNCSGSQAYSVTMVCPTLTLSPATLPGGTVGTAYSQTITTSGATGTYTYAVTSGGLPAGLSLSTAGVLSGTPTTSGTSDFTVTATLVGTNCTGSQAYGVTMVCPTLTLAPATLPGGTVGTAYNQTITTSGATGTYTYAVTSGSLPAGLTLSSAGVLSGTPTTSGSSDFTVTATFVGTNCTGSQAYSVTMVCPTLTLAPATLPGGTVGSAYSQTITTSGATGTFTYAVTSGSLPAGLSLSTAGVLSGTPTASGTSDFTVTATFVGTNCSGSQAYSVTMVCPTLTLAPATLPGGTVGTSYTQTITTSGATGTFTYAVTSGSLPAGLTLSTAGLLSGNPTTSGTSDFTVTATFVGTNCSGSQAYSVTMVCPTLTLAPATLPGGTVGTAYTQTITTSGATGTFTYAVTSGSLPAGLSLSTAGVLSGTPTVSGTSNFTVTATLEGTNCTGSQAYGVTIVCPTLTLSPAKLPGGTVGTVYSQTITTSGATGTYTYAVTSGSLPAGLSLSTAGVLSGTPTVPGTSDFTVTATLVGAGCTGSRAYSLTVVCPTITLSPVPLPTPILGVPYSQTITASGGTGPYTFAVTAGALPAGLTLSPAGLLSGTPTALAPASFTVTATDTSSGCTGIQAYAVAAFSAFFKDDYGRSLMCVNRLTGTFTYQILVGPGAGTYAGTCVVMNGGTKYVNPVGAPYRMNMTYDPIRKKASGYYITSGGAYNALSDANTASNTGVCSGAIPE